MQHLKEACKKKTELSQKINHALKDRLLLSQKVCFLFDLYPHDAGMGSTELGSPSKGLTLLINRQTEMCLHLLHKVINNMHTLVCIFVRINFSM